LAEIGADFELREVPIDNSAQRGSVYSAVNPQRNLPTLLTPQGETLTESAAILLTLAERHPEANLLPPAASIARAQVLRWLIFVAAEIYPVIEIKDYPERFQPEGEDTADSRRDELREHARYIWKRRWLLVESAASDEQWFLPGSFSLLDIYVAVISRWAQTDDWRPQHLPRVERIAGAVATRHSLAAVWKRNFG
jgi:glutathione S-transferase